MAIDRFDPMFDSIFFAETHPSPQAFVGSRNLHRVRQRDPTHPDKRESKTIICSHRLQTVSSIISLTTRPNEKKALYGAANRKSAGFFSI